MADDDFHTREALTQIMALLERKLWLNSNDTDAVKNINDHIKAIRAKGDAARKRKALAEANGTSNADIQAVVHEAWSYLMDAMRNDRFNAPVRIQAAQAICELYACDTDGLLWEVVDGPDHPVCGRPTPVDESTAVGLRTEGDVLLPQDRPPVPQPPNGNVSLSALWRRALDL